MKEVRSPGVPIHIDTVNPSKSINPANGEYPTPPSGELSPHDSPWVEDQDKILEEYRHRVRGLGKMPQSPSNREYFEFRYPSSRRDGQ